MTLLNRRIDGQVLVLEFARARNGNVLSRALQDELAHAWEQFENDDELRVAVLQGTAQAFSVGHDVEELAADPTRSPVPSERFYPLHLTKPVIAAIDGPCYGLGFELALACDLRVAGAGARFGFVDPHLHVPFRVASVLLPRMTFMGSALELVFSGRVFTADELRDLGLVSDVVEQGAAAAKAMQLARDLARRFGVGRSFRKQAVWSLSGMPLPAAMRIARAVR